MSRSRHHGLVILACLAAAACTGTEQPPADTTGTMAPPAAAPAPAAPPAAAAAGMVDAALLARYAGTWEGHSMPADRDTVIATWRMTSTADTSGWTITFPEREPLPVRVVAAAGDSVTMEFGPFESFSSPGQQQNVRAVSRLEGDRATITYLARLVAIPDSVFRGRAEATRTP